jgi:N-acetylmuramoyl-L-alanine amidase
MSRLLDKILELIATFKAAQKAVKRKPKKIGNVAICIGHSRIGDKGARSVGGISEWVYNSEVAVLLAKQLKQRGIASVIIDDYPSESYGGAMRWLSKEVDKTNADVAIELHFNSFSSSSAEGYEYLYYAGSAEGKRLALCIHKAHQSKSVAQKDRGAKPIERKDRGGHFVTMVKPPAVICEPFFGSSPKEWVLLGQKPAVVADIYATGIFNYFK